MEGGLGKPIILPAPTIVYRRNFKRDVEYNPGRLFWCSLTDPGGDYGPWMHKFEFAKDLKLVNVTTKEFREGCKAAIDSIPDLDDDTRTLLHLPFGLAGYDQTRWTLENSSLSTALKTLSSATHNQLMDEFDGCMRTSVSDVDRSLMEFLRNRFGSQYDGYIAPVAIPGLLHGKFPAEICLFVPSEDVLSHLKSASLPPGMQLGGATKLYHTIKLNAHDGSLTTYEDEEVDEPRDVFHTIQLGEFPHTPLSAMETL